MKDAYFSLRFGTVMPVIQVDFLLACFSSLPPFPSFSFLFFFFLIKNDFRTLRCALKLLLCHSDSLLSSVLPTFSGALI